MGQPIIGRCILLLNVVMLAACAVDSPLSQPSVRAPAPTSTTTPSLSSITAPVATLDTTRSPSSARAPTITPAPISATGQELPTALGREITPEPTLFAPSPTLLPATATAAPSPTVTTSPQTISADNLNRLHQQHEVGTGGATTLALSPDGAFLAVGTTAGWGLYALPSLTQVRFDPIAEGVGGLTWSSDSHLVAVLANQRDEITIYRTPDGAPIGRVQRYAPVFSPDGRLVASLLPNSTSVGGPGGTILPSTVVLTRIGGDAILDTLPSLSTEGVLAFSPDSHLIATMIGTDTQLWTVGSSVEDGPLAHMPGTFPIFSPDGRILATTVFSATATEVRLWQVPSGRPLARLMVGDITVGPPPIAFSDDGTLLYVVAARQLQVWNIARGRRMSVTPVSSIYDRLEPDGHVLISYPGGTEQTPQGIRFTRISDGRTLYEDRQTVFGYGSPDTVALSRDSATAAYAAYGGVVRLVDLQYGTARDLPLAGYVAASFSPNGKLLAALVTGTMDVALLRADDGTLVQQLAPPAALSRIPELSFERLDFAPDGHSLVATGVALAEHATQAVAVRWELAGGGTGQIVWQLNVPNDDSPARISSAYVYSAADHAAVWADSRGIQFQRANGPVMILAAPSATNVLGVAFSPDGRWLAAVDTAGTIQLYRVAPTTVTHTQTLLGTPGIQNVTFIQDSTLFGTILPDGSGLVWRIGEPSPLWLYGQAANATTYNLRAFAITPDQQLLIASRADDIGFYRISDGQVVGTLPIRGGALAISPLGDQFAVNIDGRLSLWGLTP